MITINKIINSSLREVSRYWDETKLVTVPYASCIDISDFDVVSVVNVYRATSPGSIGQSGMLDPAQWMIFSNGGTLYNLHDYMLNYAAWSTVTQIRNTVSTELSWEEDHQAGKLYINNTLSNPTNMITIKYIPNLTNPEDVKSSYWNDILVRMCVAKLKIEEGRIRKRYQLSNAPWSQDVDILTEGQDELKELREMLTQNDNIFQICD